jgi:hypothetical protein
MGNRQCGKGSPVGNVDLSIDVMKMNFDGAFRNAQSFCDYFIGDPFRNRRHYLSFSRGEGFSQSHADHSPARFPL